MALGLGCYSGHFFAIHSGVLGGPGIVLHLVKAMVFDEIDVFASTGSQILKIPILRATLPREKSL